MTVSTVTVRMAKSRPRKNQSERSDLPCHIIIELICCARRLLNVTKSLLSNRVCQHCSLKTSTVTPSFHYAFNFSLCCNNSIPSFTGNLWRVLLLGNHLKAGFFLFYNAVKKSFPQDDIKAIQFKQMSTFISLICSF